MNIEEIREEIPKAFCLSVYDTDTWIGNNGKPDFNGSAHSADESRRIAARMLVDMAYKAGLDQGYEFGRQFDIATGAVNEHWYDGYEHGSRDAAKDPSAWYVLDKNGEQVHIGDTVKTIRGDKFEVKCLGNDALTTWNKNGDVHDPYKASCLEKVIPDTREKIKDELSDIFLTLVESDFDTDVMDKYEAYSANDVAEQFISRIEALGER